MVASQWQSEQMAGGRLKVAVLFGGRSPEHDISIITGLQALNAIDPEIFDPFPVYISTSGEWFVGEALARRSTYIPGSREMAELTPVSLHLGRKSKLALSTIPKGIMQRSKKIEADFALLAFHGLYGEDGRIQSLLEIAGIPYSGMRPLASAMFMDKIVTKHLLGSADIPQLPYRKIKRPEQGLLITEEELEKNLSDVTFPCCIKPCHLGSSIGVAKVENWQELSDVLPAIFRYDDSAVLESFVNNLAEYNVSVCRLQGKIRTSAIERPRHSSELLDFKAKYLSGGAKGTPEKMPGQVSQGMLSLTRDINPQLPPALDAKIRGWAAQAFRLIDGTGAPRVDFLYDLDAEQLWLNEINPCPGSFGYFLWEAAEEPILFSRLLELLIEEGLRQSTATQLPPDPTPEEARLFPRR
jgi:D-alanine-D-alanine ligase